MEYNLITNIESCYVDVPHLLYYSHIPATIIVLFFGFFLLFKNKENKLASIILFFISIIFSIWTTLAIVLWNTYSSITMMSLWSLFGLMYVLMYMLGLYFMYVFIEKKDISPKIKYFFLILLLPLIYLSPTKYNLSGFDVPNCQPIESDYFNMYEYSIGIFIIILISILIYKEYKKTKQKQIFFVGLGILLFLVAFSWSEIAGSITDNFTITQYGLFGAPVFIAFLVYSIVRFKSFDIKLLGAQALVWSLIILIGSQFTFIQNPTNKILTAITLVISGTLGLILVRGVKREVALREQLQVANAGQTNLIHIMNHQIKGYLGISKNIFAELLTDDYGKIPEEAKDIVTQGLENADKGTKYVTAILKGESAENGTLSYEMVKFDFKELVSEVVNKERDMAEKKGLKLNFSADSSDYNITGDISQIGEAVRNLIDNSIYYTPTGSILVNLVKNNGVLLKVTDTGVGIKPEDKDKLFKAGGVGSESIKINTNSSGYGLAFVKGVIEKHNGKVWFESEGAGKGSTFYIELPVK